MAFTKINAAGIGSTETVTLDGLTVINDGSFGGNVSVGGTLTYEDVTNIDSVGLITARAGVVVGSGITLSKDGDVFFTGIATGNGSGLTALNASNLGSGTVPTARLGSGTASSSTFLRGDSTFQTVNTDLVSDTSPQLGGTLDTNGNLISFPDSGGVNSNRLKIGTGNDIEIFHVSDNSYLDFPTNYNAYFRTGADRDTAILIKPNNAVELYYDNTKRFETTSNGVSVTGDVSAEALTATNGNAINLADSKKINLGNSSDLQLYYDGSDGFVQLAGIGGLRLESDQTLLRSADSSETYISTVKNGAVELYYDNEAKILTKTNGATIQDLTSSGAYLDIKGSDGVNGKVYGVSGTTIGFLDNQNHFLLKGVKDGAVELYYDNSKKFETTADGVRVTDNGSNNLDLHTNRFIVNRDEAFYFDQNNTGNSFIFRVSNSSGLDTNSLQLYSEGHAYFVSRSTTASSITIRKGVSGADSIDYIQCRANSNAAKFIVNGDGTVRSAANTYTSTSDVKMKENVVDANSQWSDIKAVKVRNFNFKESTGLPTLKQIGVIAQELETTSPNLVEESIDRDPDTGEDLGTTTKNVKYSILYMKSVKALQEAMARIETLEAEVAALKG